MSSMFTINSNNWDVHNNDAEVAHLCVGALKCFNAESSYNLLKTTSSGFPGAMVKLQTEFWWLGGGMTLLMTRRLRQTYGNRNGRTSGRLGKEMCGRWLAPLWSSLT